MKTMVAVLTAGVLVAGLTGCASAEKSEQERLSTLLTDAICVMHTEMAAMQELVNGDLSGMTSEQAMQMQADMEKKSADVEQKLMAMTTENGFENDAAVQEAINRVSNEQEFQKAIVEKAKQKCGATDETVNGAFSQMF